MTGKTQAWGLALAILAGLLILLAIHWPSALIGVGVGGLLGARAPWIAETLKKAWAGILARLTRPPAQARALLTLPSKSPNVWQALRGLGDGVKLALVIGAIALVIWLFVSVSGFFRDVGCGVRALTFWPCETKASLREERDQARRATEIERANADLRGRALEAADDTLARDQERTAFTHEARAQILNRPPNPPPLVEAHDPEIETHSPPLAPDPALVWRGAIEHFGLRSAPELQRGAFGASI